MCVCIFCRANSYCVGGEPSFFKDGFDHLVVAHLRVVVLGTSGRDQWFCWILRVHVIAGEAFVALSPAAAVVITSLDWLGVWVLINSPNALRNI